MESDITKDAQEINDPKNLSFSKFPVPGIWLNQPRGANLSFECVAFHRVISNLLPTDYQLPYPRFARNVELEHFGQRG
jgi:hypothetical protein